MEKDIVIYKNRIEVKILSIVYFIVFVPILIILLVETVKRGINELWSYIIMFGCFFLFFWFWLFIIARYRVKFDFINEICYINLCKMHIKLLKEELNGRIIPI